MTDRANSTASPPEDWESIAVFRETFLSVQLDPQDAANLRGFGRWLRAAALSCDAPCFGPGESLTRVELRAAAADLRQMQGFLADLGQHHLQLDLDQADTGLSLLAAELAEQLSQAASRIEADIGPPPSTELDGP